MWTLRKKEDRIEGEGGREGAPVYIYKKDPPKRERGVSCESRKRQSKEAR